MKNFNYQLHGDFNTNPDTIATDSDNISQTAECAENPDFTNGENRRTICSTTTIYGNRSRYTSGIFLPKIHQNHGLTTPVIHSEFAVRATPRNKAETIRTNKGGCYMAVVEPLSHPFSDKPLSLTKTIYTMNKSTQTPSGNNTARGVSTAITHRQAEKFFTAGLAQDSDAITTVHHTLADFPELCGFSPKNNRLLSFALFRILTVQSEKEIAERGNSNNINWRTQARLSFRAFFVRGLRTPKENNRLKIEFVAFLSMVGRNGQRLIVGCSPVGAVFHPVTLYRQAWKLAVDVQNLQLGFSAMLFKFLTGSRLKITIRANSEQEARQRLQLSDDAICIARYSNAFLAQKQARMTACKGVSANSVHHQLTPSVEVKGGLYA